MENLDKVSDVYYGKTATPVFTQKTRERVNWISSKAVGMNVLDIGCSQGIVELILAKEGKHIVGIDIVEQSIQYANELFSEENDSIKDRVKLINTNIFDYETDEKFDTVILAEVMEHFSNAARLLEKAYEFLNDLGVIVITVPFGINDYFDHKKTYYCSELIQEIELFFEISEAKFFGRWIGVVATKKADAAKGFLKTIKIEDLESNFYIVERELVDSVAAKNYTVDKLKDTQKENQAKIVSLQEANKQLNNSIEQLKENQQSYESEISQLKEKQQSYEAEISQLKEKQKNNEQEFDKYKEKLSSCGLEGDSLEAIFDDVKTKLDAKNKIVLSRLESEEETLHKMNDLSKQYAALDAQYNDVYNKYDALSRSKLGRLTLKYWKIRADIDGRR